MFEVLSCHRVIKSSFRLRLWKLSGKGEATHGTLQETNARFCTQRQQKAPQHPSPPLQSTTASAPAELATPASAIQVPALTGIRPSGCISCLSGKGGGCNPNPSSGMEIQKSGSFKHPRCRDALRQVVEITRTLRAHDCFEREAPGKRVRSYSSIC